VKVLLDTNIVLDLLLEREPFCSDARDIFMLIETNKAVGVLCSTTITTLYYLINKSMSKVKTNNIIESLLKLFDIANVDKAVLLDAVKNSGSDFEDSVIYTSAKLFNVDVIVTRDKKGFNKSTLTVMQPKEFLLKYSNL